MLFGLLWLFSRTLIQPRLSLPSVWLRWGPRACGSWSHGRWEGEGI